MSVLAGGRRSVPPTTARVQLAPGKRAVIDIARLGLTPDASVVIDATGPVVVERASSGMPGITVAEAVPDLDR
jgi:hypothetical protein